MTEYEKAYDLVIKEFQDLDCRELEDYHKRKYGFSLDLHIWEIKTKIVDSSQEMIEILFWIQFPKDFPIEFPVIYLHKDSYSLFQYLPHVESDGKICVFTNQAEPNTDLPHKVVKKALHRAKSVLEDGLQKRNFDQYIDEFESYWCQPYQKKEQVLHNYLIILEESLLEKANMLILEKEQWGFKYIIYQREEDTTNIKLLLKEKRINWREGQVFVFEELSFILNPPFNLNNLSIAKKIAENSAQEYKRFEAFYNTQKAPKIFLFKKKIKNTVRYFGWKHEPVKYNKGSKVPSGIKKFSDLKRFHPLDPIVRIFPQVYSVSRLVERSVGELGATKVSRHFAFAGLGSIGSHLAQMLDSMEINMTLMDNDFLSVENTGRHVLGFDYVNQPKSEALKKHFLSRYPLRQIISKPESVIQMIKKEPDSINNCDFLFVCIGEYNKEAFIAEMLKKKILTTPTFILWVEPYLAAGHCLYLNPRNPNYEKFHKNNEFLHNVISDQSHEALSRQEAGCQSIYTPYSNSHVICFLGSVIKHIQQIMEDPCQFETQVFSWIGDLRVVKSLGIELADCSLQSDYGKVIKYE